MLQFCCDRCRKTIDTDAENRYVLKLDLQKAIEREDREDPNDRDYLIEVDQILCDEEESQDDPAEESNCFRKTFDLCESCYGEYARNPLSVEVSAPATYSPN
jgi:hypothetical protein